MVERLAEHQKQVFASQEIAAGETMPGYRSYEDAIEAQLEFREPAEPVLPAEDAIMNSG